VNADTRSPRWWLARVRSLRDRKTREQEGACFVEGIRQVLSAIEAGVDVEALLVDPERLNSDIAWQAISTARAAGAAWVPLRTAEFERVSSRDNPVGLAAVLRWTPGTLDALPEVDDGLYLLADDVRDPGNMGTLIRTVDAAGGAALIVHAGTDPGHAAALRAALGTTFQLPIASATTLDAFFDWAAERGVSTLATSAKADGGLWDVPLSLPAAVLVGNEGDGLAASTVERCDTRVRIPMYGTATSLNVSVAAGVMLYELRRRSP
jgi:RNA methyltransferase, TrmH family